MEILEWFVKSPILGLCALLLLIISGLLILIGFFVKSKATGITNDLETLFVKADESSKKITDVKEHVLESTVKINQYMTLEFQEMRKNLPSEFLKQDMVKSINKTNEISDELKKMKEEHKEQYLAFAKVLKQYRIELNILHTEVKDERTKRGA